MKISVVGTGYVGLVSGACFAEMGNDVWCIDIDEKKIENLKNSVIPIYEPGLEEIVKNNIKAGRIKFTTDYGEAVPESDICFIAVGTPPGEDGSADTKYVFQAAESIAKYAEGYTVIVDKSTVPVGTAEKVKEKALAVLNQRGTDAEIDVVSNPEFLKEGVAVEDFMRPDRVVIGVDSSRAEKVMKELYHAFVMNEHPVIFMDTKSAEITKYAANAMLATRISFMNEIARLCDIVGGDVSAVRQGIGSDSRIGMSFLYAGGGYGGSCFPKDVKELIAVGKRNGMVMKIAQAVEDVNNDQKHYIMGFIDKKFGTDLSGKTFALWGLAFKPQTDDMREASAITVAKEIVKRGGRIKAYDPKAFEQAHIYLDDIKDSIEYVEDMCECINSCDALVLMTEWSHFRNPDFIKIKNMLKEPVLFDTKNIYDPVKMRELGFEYFCIGRNNVK